MVSVLLSDMESFLLHVRCYSQSSPFSSLPTAQRESVLQTLPYFGTTIALTLKANVSLKKKKANVIHLFSG